MRKIALFGKRGQGKFTIVDDEDYEYLNQWKWYLTDRGYVRSRKRGVNRWIHRLILPPQRSLVIDHINRNPLDNRKVNLRIATKSQNNMNRKTQTYKTGKYKGVIFYKTANRNKRWGAFICKNYKRYYLGMFCSQEEAALAYNRKAVELFGDFAKLNIVENLIVSFF